MASSYLIQTHNAILNNLKSIDVESDARDGKFYYINIWNNQIEEMLDGDNYSFNTPSCFIEMIQGECAMLMGRIATYPNCIFKFHVVLQKLNEGNDMEQNMDVFLLRDEVVRKFLNSFVDNCSQMMLFGDLESYKHKNTYEFIVSFKTHYTDMTGSIYDQSTLIMQKLNNPTMNVLFPYAQYQTEDGDGEYEYIKQ